MLHLPKVLNRLCIQLILLFCLLHGICCFVIFHTATGINVNHLQAAPVFQLTGKALIHADTNRNHNHDRSRPDYNAKHRQRRPQPSLPEVAQCHINHVTFVHKDIPSLSSSWITSVTSSTKSSSSKSSSKSSALLTLSAVLFGGSF